jgi:probable HAF family extracellular repeat protein
MSLEARGKSHACAGVFAFLLFLLPGLLYAASGVNAYEVVQVNPPGATSPYPAALNKSSEVVGSFTAASGATEGFSLKKGVYSTLVVPGSNNFTRASGINDSGVIVGDFYTSNDNAYHGYLYKKGKFTQYDVQLGTLSTSIFGINNAGNFVGSIGSNGNPNQAFINIGGNLIEFYGSGTSSSYAYGINSSNDVVGDYYDSSNNPHCFYRSSSGTVSQINVPNSYLTACNGINDAGVIAGFYVDATGVHAFLDAEGVVTELPFYYASDVNNVGDVVGFYNGPGGPNGVQYGFLATPAKFASYASIQMTGAQSTAIYGINDSKAMVGTYTDSSNATHGLLFAKKKITNIDDPHAQAGTTAAYSINTPGDIVGGYTNGGGVGVGFYYSGGTYTDIAPAGAQFTNPSGINDSGVIAGLYVDGSGNTHGFTYNGSTYVNLDVPNAQWTGCWGVNNSGAVTCQWGDQNGFIRSSLYNGSSFTSIDVPGAWSSGVHSINKDGDIVFVWGDPYGNNHGAMLKAGSYYVFDVPPSLGANTDADGINDAGEIVGHFTPTGSSNSEGWQGKL